jgi:sec-independent protein translocase protein TatA
MGPVGPLELIIVLVIVLVIFGPKRLPSLGRQLGSGMREFKDSVTGKDRDGARRRRAARRGAAAPRLIRRGSRRRAAWPPPCGQWATRNG